MVDQANSSQPYQPHTRFLSCKTDCILSCGERINGRTHPLQVDTEGAVSVLRNAATYAQAGWYFSVADFFVAPNDGSFLAFAFENPAENNKLLYLDKVAAGLFVNQVTGTRIGNEEALQLTIAETSRFELIRETFTPQNNRVGSPNTSTMIVRRLGTISFEGDLFMAIYSTGHLNQEFEGQIILPPGKLLLVVLETLADNLNNALLAATVTWWERPLIEKKKKTGTTEQNSVEDLVPEKGKH